MRGNVLVFIASVGLILFSGPQAAFCGDYHSEPYSGSAEFERMRGLKGTWEGKMTMGGEEKTYRVEYRITGGGSAIVETHFPGTPEEMITVYNDNGGNLGLTHYCALKNQPRMELQKSGEKYLDFAFAGGSNIDPAKDPHMHALTITFGDEDTITQKWTLFESGRVKEVSTFTLSRTK